MLSTALYRTRLVWTRNRLGKSFRSTMSSCQVQLNFCWLTQSCTFRVIAVDFTWIFAVYGCGVLCPIYALHIHTIGLHCRNLQQEYRDLSNPQHNILDGQLLWRYLDMSIKDKHEFASRIGTTMDQVSSRLASVPPWIRCFTQYLYLNVWQANMYMYVCTCSYQAVNKHENGLTSSVCS